MRNLAVAGLFAAALTLVPGGAGAFTPEKAQQSFQKFCAGWMGKLREREVRNEQLVKFQRRGQHYVGEYNGYAQRPESCEVKATGVPEAPYVGKLVYNELLYRKTATDERGARGAKPQVVGQTRVLEIFSFRGGRWAY